MSNDTPSPIQPAASGRGVTARFRGRHVPVLALAVGLSCSSPTAPWVPDHVDCSLFASPATSR